MLVLIRLNCSVLTFSDAMLEECRPGDPDIDCLKYKVEV